MISRVAPVVGAAVLAVMAASPVAAQTAETYCTPTDPALTELSGTAVVDGSVYAMGDSGADEVILRLDGAECAVAERIPNPTDPLDVEDLASFDGLLWLADIGDNDRQRDTVALVQVDPATGAGDLRRLTFPDGAHDAEALLVGSDGRPVIVTKDALGGGVYTADIPVTDLPSPGPTALTRVADFAPASTGTPGGPPLLDGGRLVTGGAVSADGSVAAVRTYTDVYLWSVDDGDVAAALSSPPAQVLPLPAQPQGESIAFTDDGDLLVGSEQGFDTAAALPAILVLRDVADGVGSDRPVAAQSSAAPGAEASPSESADSEAPAEPTGSILIPLVAAAVSVGVVVAVTALLLRRLFR